MATDLAFNVLWRDKGAGRGLDKLGKDMDRAGRSTGRLGNAVRSGMAKVGKAVALGAAAGAAALAAFVGVGLKSLVRIEKITAQTAAAISSTGAAANVTAKHIVDLGSKIEGLTGIEQESIQEGQNLLLTFTQIQNKAGKGNDIFDQATRVMTDMSVALGQDMKSSSIQLGKALNDPIKGVTALQRVGVSFTQGQRDQIKAMVEAGDVMGAQKLILAELNKEFGGSAEAFGATTAGKVERFKHAIGSLQEEIASLLLPVLLKLSGWAVKTGVPALEKLGKIVTTGLKAMVAAFKEGDVTSDGFVGAMERVGMFVRGVADVVRNKVIPVITFLGRVFLNVAGWVAANVLPVFAKISQWVSKNQEIIPALGIAIGVVLVPAFIAWAIAAGAAAVATIAAAAPFILVGAAITALAFLVIKNFDTIKGAISGAFNWVKRNWPLLLAILTGPIGLAVLAITRNWDTIKSGVTKAKDWVKARLSDMVNAVAGIPGRIGRAASGMWDGIKFAFKSAINWVIRGWNRLSFTLPSVKTIFGNIGGWTLGTLDIKPLARGGIVTRPTLAMVGEAGPEAVIPLGRGGGGMVTVNVYGAVGDPQAIARMIQGELLKLQRSGVRLGFVG